MTEQEGDMMMSPEEAAVYLGVSRRTLESYARRGKIKRYKGAFRNVFFKRSDLDEFKRLRSQEEER